MPVGRYARHTKPQLLQAIREKILYRDDLVEGVGASKATLAIHAHSIPVWNFHTGANDYVLGDVKIPVERVPGTKMVFRPVFHLLPGGNQPAGIVWRLDYMASGIRERMALVPTVTRREVVAGLGTGELYMSPGIIIWPSELDPRPNGIIDFYLYREGLNPLDTFNTTVNLFKLVVQHTAYV